VAHAAAKADDAPSNGDIPKSVPAASAAKAKHLRLPISVSLIGALSDDLKNIPSPTSIRRLLTISRCCDCCGEFRRPCTMSAFSRQALVRAAVRSWRGKKGRLTPPIKGAAPALNSVGEPAARP
jgi:hypothetical protein